MGQLCRHDPATPSLRIAACDAGRPARSRRDRHCGRAQQNGYTGGRRTSREPPTAIATSAARCDTPTRRRLPYGVARRPRSAVAARSAATTSHTIDAHRCTAADANRSACMTGNGNAAQAPD
ncbi:conserved hypothetical protein [Ricinus communis]|uniref:Uncharacterized protein n=1 Tax=Ricinus communis TaxID=3988 RepID=B9TKF8_RICCO|nr:conserved hypothetical protein [Ricinus communis]